MNSEMEAGKMTYTKNNEGIGQKRERAIDKENEESQKKKTIELSTTIDYLSSEAIPLHPLLIDLVFEKILGYCTLKSLYNCRLTCRQWSNVAWNQILERKLFSFTGRNVDVKIKYFLELLANNDNEFPKKLEFGGFIVKDYRSELEILFDIVGHQLKKLTLHFEDEQVTLEELEEIFLRKTPQLEHLSLLSLPCTLFHELQTDYKYEVILEQLKWLKLGSRCHYVNDLANENFFTYVLSLSPNLEKLEGYVGFCVPNLVNSIDKVNLLKLTHLALRGSFDEETARILERFQLETLYLGVAGHYNDDYKHNVVYQQRNTLSSLGIGWASFQSRIRLQNIRSDFPSLTCLTLSDPSRWTFESSPKEYKPGNGIMKLRADLRKVDDYNYLSSNARSFETLRELDLSFLNEDVQAIAISITTDRQSLFPNVTKLTVRIPYNFILGPLFHSYANLESLSLIYTHSNSTLGRHRTMKLRYLDSCLVGLSEAACTELRLYESLVANEASKERYNPNSKSRSYAEWRNKPISSLQNLKRLTIYGDQLAVSDLTIDLCLGRMTQLTALTIQPATGGFLNRLRSKLSPAVYMDIKEDKWA